MLYIPSLFSPPFYFFSHIVLIWFFITPLIFIFYNLPFSLKNTLDFIHKFHVLGFYFRCFLFCESNFFLVFCFWLCISENLLIIFSVCFHLGIWLLAWLLSSLLTLLFIFFILSFSFSLHFFSMCVTLLMILAVEGYFTNSQGFCLLCCVASEILLLQMLQ